MRTRRDGTQLTLDGALEDAVELGRRMEAGGLTNSQAASEFFELGKDIRELVNRERKIAFDEGMQLGARVEHRVAVEALQQAALTVLGKDRGDGAIDLGALGSPVYKEA